MLCCPREREPLDQFGGSQRLLFGPQAHEVPAVYLEISGLAGRVLGIDFLKRFEERLQIVWEAVSQRPTLLGFRQVVHDYDRTGACLRFGARAIIGLAIG